MRLIIIRRKSLCSAAKYSRAQHIDIVRYLLKCAFSHLVENTHRDLVVCWARSAWLRIKLDVRCVVFVARLVRTCTSSLFTCVSCALQLNALSVLQDPHQVFLAEPSKDASA